MSTYTRILISGRPGILHRSEILPTLLGLKSRDRGGFQTHPAPASVSAYGRGIPCLPGRQAWPGIGAIFLVKAVGRRIVTIPRRRGAPNPNPRERRLTWTDRLNMVNGSLGQKRLSSRTTPAISIITRIHIDTNLGTLGSDPYPTQARGVELTRWITPQKTGRLSRLIRIGGIGRLGRLGILDGYIFYPD